MGEEVYIRFCKDQRQALSYMGIKLQLLPVLLGLTYEIVPRIVSKKIRGQTYISGIW